MKWEIIKKFSAINKSCFRYKDPQPSFQITYLNGIHGHVNEIIPGFGLKINIEVNSLKDILLS